MAKTPKGRSDPALKRLVRQQKAREKHLSQLKTLQKRYEANLSLIEKQYRSEYETYIRAYRSEVAKAKKAGLVSKSVDARKAVPQSNLSKALGRAYRVITGEARAQKVSPKLAKFLKDQDYQVVRNRVIIPKGTRINKKGDFVTGSGNQSRKITVIKITANIDEQIADIMANMSDEETIAVSLPNHNVSGQYSNFQFDEFMEKIYSYAFDKDGKAKMKYLYINQLYNIEQQRAFDEERVKWQLKRKEIRKSTKRQKKQFARLKKSKRASSRSKRVRKTTKKL